MFNKHTHAHIDMRMCKLMESGDDTICSNYSIKISYVSGYKNGNWYCSKCAVFWKPYDNSVCPCCTNPLRTKPRGKSI